MTDIENLDNLLQDYLGDREVISYSTTNLTAPGENYGSLMLKLDITVANPKDGGENIVYAVAKTPPPNEELRKAFNTVVTFKNEIAFYQLVFPEFRKIQKKYGLKPVSYFPEILAARNNLNGGGAVDDNAVLVLENLALKNFVTENRFKGFNLETTKMILRDLANMHATGIAIKIQTPDVFEEKIKPYLDGMVHDDPEDQFLDLTCKALSKIFLKNEHLNRFESKVIKIIKKPLDYKVKQPWATISHNDLWVNNTMVKYEEGKPVENKFVDFQTCRYHSATSDLIFLLLISIQDDVIKDKLDYFLDYYHQEFVKTLEALQCDIEPFSKESFEEELLYVKNDELHHIFSMIFPIFMDKSEAKELKDFSLDGELPFFTNISPRLIEKLELVLNLLDKKGWLD